MYINHTSLFYHISQEKQEIDANIIPLAFLSMAS